MSVKHASNRKIMAIAKVAALLGQRSPDRTMTRTVTMEETSGGWKLHNDDGFVPLVEQRHVARFRQMVVSGSL
ncbi:hypothetical protein [Acidiphilium acidophilum]|uniref:hypothetical protein n=1 Tax=Acidiphilium acidophilum TaxID=76588 RepID=UPI002E8E72DC|nr:hypothetical protein [Acidiphilium acidophilum]